MNILRVYAIEPVQETTKTCDDDNPTRETRERISGMNADPARC